MYTVYTRNTYLPTDSVCLLCSVIMPFGPSVALMTPAYTPSRSVAVCTHIHTQYTYVHTIRTVYLHIHITHGPHEFRL